MINAMNNVKLNQKENYQIKTIIKILLKLIKVIKIIQIMKIENDLIQTNIT